MTFNDFQKVIDIYESHGYAAKTFCEKCGTYVPYTIEKQVVCQGCNAPIILLPTLDMMNGTRNIEKEKLLMFELLLEGQVEKHMYRNFYQCPHCEYKWEDEWDCQCDDDCPHCGKRHIEPYSWEDA